MKRIKLIRLIIIASFAGICNSMYGQLNDTVNFHCSDTNIAISGFFVQREPNEIIIEFEVDNMADGALVILEPDKYFTFHQYSVRSELSLIEFAFGSIHLSNSDPFEFSYDKPGEFMALAPESCKSFRNTYRFEKPIMKDIQYEFIYVYSVLDVIIQRKGEFCISEDKITMNNSLGFRFGQVVTSQNIVFEEILHPVLADDVYAPVETAIGTCPGKEN